MILPRGMIQFCWYRLGSQTAYTHFRVIPPRYSNIHRTSIYALMYFQLWTSASRQYSVLITLVRTDEKMAVSMWILLIKNDTIPSEGVEKSLIWASSWIFVGLNLFVPWSRLHFFRPASSSWGTRWKPTEAGVTRRSLDKWELWSPTLDLMSSPIHPNTPWILECLFDAL